MRKLRNSEIDHTDAEGDGIIDKHPICCVLDSVRSIHNVGSVFRTAEAAGVERLYLTGITGTPEHRAIRKTALGAEESVDWIHNQSAVETIHHLRSLSYTIVALELTDTPTMIEDLRHGHFPMALILGNEVDGVSQELLDLSDFAVQIRQFGFKQSLNVSVAFGIGVFGLVNKYRSLLSEGVA